MLVGLCKYVILGHSERRQYFGETDEGVNKKAHAAFKHGLVPIIAVGENLAQNQAGETDQVVRTQVAGGLQGLGQDGETLTQFDFGSLGGMQAWMLSKLHGIKLCKQAGGLNTGINTLVG